MTNEQLAVLLTGYHDELVDALGKVAKALPPECARHGTDFFSRPTKRYPVLDPVAEVRDTLAHAIAVLERKT